MNNKNTILLTVIAVATLLVAVVGATFAYFTVSQASGTANTTVTAKAEAVGSVVLDNADNNLVLEVTAQEMAQGNEKKYYAVKSGTAAKNSTDGTPISIAKATISNPGESTYTCTATFTVAASGNMAEALEEGDAKVVLSGAANDEFDLSADKLGEKSTTVATFELSAGNETKDVKALVSLENRNAEQNELAGKQLDVTISADSITCSINEQ